MTDKHKLGLAIVGASGRATSILTYLQEHPEQGFVAGIYDLAPVRTRFLLDHYGLADAQVYESLEQALNDSRCESVFVGTWDSAHREAAVAALQAGKHVFCEKPLATTLEDCDAIIDKACHDFDILNWPPVTPATQASPRSYHS